MRLSLCLTSSSHSCIRLWISPSHFVLLYKHTALCFSFSSSSPTLASSPGSLRKNAWRQGSPNPSLFLLTPPPPFPYNLLGMNTNVAQFPLTWGNDRTLPSCKSSNAPLEETRKQINQYNVIKVGSLSCTVTALKLFKPAGNSLGTLLQLTMETVVPQMFPMLPGNLGALPQGMEAGNSI